MLAPFSNKKTFEVVFDRENGGLISIEIDSGRTKKNINCDFVQRQENPSSRQRLATSTTRQASSKPRRGLKIFYTQMDYHVPV